MVSHLQRATLHLLGIFMVLLASSSDALTRLSSTLRNKARSRHTASVTIPSGWFGDFSEAESTYTTEGMDSARENPVSAVQYGRDPSVKGPYYNLEIPQAESFHESLSGGPIAWQGHTLSQEEDWEDQSFKPKVHGENTWENSPKDWVQKYKTQLQGLQKGGHVLSSSNAVWFDNSVQQIDSFGREKVPSKERAWQEIEGWKERSVNTTITCKEPGCTASSSLQLFDGNVEEAKFCKLGIHVYPTDYDKDDSLENVAFWKVNDHVAMRECSPKTKECGTVRPLYTCVSNLDVDKIVDGLGTIVVEGQNSDLVDECAYNDNLLSGVIIASCLVRSTTTTTTTAPIPHANFRDQSVMKCETAGCSAMTFLAIDPFIVNKTGGKCTLNVSVFQTDFDGSNGVVEQIDFLAVEGTNITTATPAKPGKNPCLIQAEGTNVTSADRIFEAVKSYDVTKLIRVGMINVTGKISDKVDECPYTHSDNVAYLFYANVSVFCE